MKATTCSSYLLISCIIYCPRWLYLQDLSGFFSSISTYEFVWIYNVRESKYFYFNLRLKDMPSNAKLLSIIAGCILGLAFVLFVVIDALPLWYVIICNHFHCKLLVLFIGVKWVGMALKSQWVYGKHAVQAEAWKSVLI
jgi:hypothetical protein